MQNTANELKYNVNKVYMSIQGEGASVGAAAVFLRFTGCNENCEFCDTNYSQYSEVSLEMILQKIREVLQEKQWPVEGSELKRLRLVFTGGEPLLQLDHELLMAIKQMGFVTCIETNGTEPTRLPIMDLGLGVDEVVVSPKMNIVSDAVLRRAGCLKVVVPLLQDRKAIEHMVGMMCQDSKIPDLILQPITPRKGITSWQYQANCKAAEHIALTWRRDYNENWRVIPQTHVIMGFR